MGKKKFALQGALQCTKRKTAFVPGYRHPRTFIPQSIPVREFIRYTMSPDFSPYSLHFFQELSDLQPKILDNSHEKWLIFTDSKERGKAFGKTLGSKCLYLDADSKSTADWNAIISAKRFEQQVLVTTSALDNGIDIIDPDVKNIAIVADNRTSLITPCESLMPLCLQSVVPLPNMCSTAWATKTFRSL